MRAIQIGTLWILALVVSTSTAIADDDAKKTDAKREALEKKFTEQMTGATFTGHFTIIGDDKKPLKKESYVIRSVKKIRGDLWLFNARVTYGTKDVTVPMPLFVRWAGDTPVITLTDVRLPSLGTYTARVVIYRNKYAGTWSGSDHGGHLFGTIKPAKKDK